MSASNANRTIAVIGGTGPEGFGLAKRWAQAGETVIIGSRDATRAQEAANKIKAKFPDANISGLENTAACAAAELLVLTVPFEGHAPLLKQLKPAIRPGSILVDATVPLAASVGGRPSRTLGVWQGSAAQANCGTRSPRRYCRGSVSQYICGCVEWRGRGGLRRHRLQRRCKGNSVDSSTRHKNSRSARDRRRQA